VADEQPEKKDKRMATTNIKVTREAHGLLKTVSDMLGVPMSDVILFMIDKQFPQADEELKRREEIQAQLKERRPKPSE
jgi:hypothetical protein